MLKDSQDHEVDRRLVQGVLAGDRAAIDELLRRLRCVPVILTVRNQKLGRPLDSASLQDLAQDTLIAIWTRLEAYEGSAPLEGWVYRFCVHKHWNEVRNRGRRVRIEVVESPLLSEACAPVEEPQADEELLHLALDALESSGARIVRLKHFDDLTFEEIGQRLSISPNTAKTQYYRALKALREFLARRGEPRS